MRDLGPRRRRSFRTHGCTAPAEYELDRRGHIEDRRFELIDSALDRAGPVATGIEIGCGTGSLLERVARARPQALWLGAEPEAGLVEYARAHHEAPNLRFLESPIESVSLPQACDFALSVDVIHHLADPPRAFAAVRGLLRPGAVWLALEPNSYHPYVGLRQEAMRRMGIGEDHFRPRTVTALLEAAGLHVESRRYLLLLPAGWSPPRALAGVERALERTPVTGGCVALSIRAR